VPIRYFSPLRKITNSNLKAVFFQELAEYQHKSFIKLTTQDTSQKQQE